MAQSISKTSNINITKLDGSTTQQLNSFFLNNHEIKKFFYPHPFSLDYLSYIVLSDNKDFYCVATMNGEVIAYGMLRGWEEGYATPSLGVAVDKEYRGLGIGELLCRYLHFIAKFRGCTKVRLKVNKENNIAKSLYEKLGYVFNEYDDEYLEGFLEL